MAQGSSLTILIEICDDDTFVRVSPVINVFDTRPVRLSNVASMIPKRLLAFPARAPLMTVASVDASVTNAICPKASRVTAAAPSETDLVVRTATADCNTEVA